MRKYDKYTRMKYDPDRHHRRSICLKGYDYLQGGAYFATICTQGRECLFGDVVDGGMRLNDAGCMIQKWLHESAKKFKNIELDESMIMPNHFHGIIVIVGAALCGRPEINYYEHIIRSEEEMNRIRKYIIDNPAKWAEDENNPTNIQ